MPELPDVEIFKQYLNATSLHHKIEAVEARSRGILADLSSAGLKKRLQGHKFKSTCRYGKYLFAALDNKKWLVLHFGMTGFLKYFKKMEEDSPHDRLLISFANGYHLAYDCQRKLGKIYLIEDSRKFVKEKGLGPDALGPNLNFKFFIEALGNRRAAVKSTLMNQKILAGIGNIYSDEILFQAGIYPKTKAGQLDKQSLQTLFKEINKVLSTAIECRADPEKFPASYVIPHRHSNGNCPKCGEKIVRLKISGRSAYYCPQCQSQKE